MRRLSTAFIAAALVLSHIMCAVVAFNYRSMLCASEHMGFSAPPTIAFLYAVPFITAILICSFLAYRFRR